MEVTELLKEFKKEFGDSFSYSDYIHWLEVKVIKLHEKISSVLRVYEEYEKMMLDENECDATEIDIY